MIVTALDELPYVQEFALGRLALAYLAQISYSREALPSNVMSECMAYSSCPLPSALLLLAMLA